MRQHCCAYRTVLRTLLCTALLALPVITLAQSGSLPPSLTVLGIGEATARPDLATIQAGVITEARTAREALTSNTAAMESLLKTLTSFGTADHDIQTTAFDVTPLYTREERSGQSARLTAYRVVNRVRITVRNLERFGEVLDALVAQGANTVEGIHFGTANPQPVLDQARRAAVEEARRKATLYAQAAGVGLGRVLTLHEEHVSPPPRPLMARTAAIEADVPIAPGELTFTARLIITYELVR